MKADDNRNSASASVAAAQLNLADYQLCKGGIGIVGSTGTPPDISAGSSSSAAAATASVFVFFSQLISLWCGRASERVAKVKVY